jgi:hypothetical protein
VNRAKGQPGDIARCGGHLQAVDPGAGGHQDVHHLGHPEHRRVLQRGAAGHAAGIRCRDRLDVGPGLDQHPGDLGVSVAGRGDQRRLLVPGRTVDRGTRFDQRPGDSAGAGQVTGQAEPAVVEPQHRHVAERSGGLVVAPVLHVDGVHVRMVS